jgi:hypothetical protein
MTVVGKILVFIVLIFSVFIGALLVMDYTKRTEWADLYTKLKGRYDMAVASEKAYKDEVVATKDAADKLVKEAEARREKAKKDLDALEDIVKDVRKERDVLKGQSTKSDAIATAGQTEIARRQTDAEELRKALSVQTKANIDLAKDMNKVREDKVAAEIQLRSMTDRATRLQDQLQESYKELVRTRTSGGAGAGARLAGGKNPPPENVEGLIKNTDPGSGLVTITIGSDAGLAKGQTLEVFRLSNVPHQSKYLGTIRILEVTATQAVGQPTGRMTAPPQAGDRVASYILGS